MQRLVILSSFVLVAVVVALIMALRMSDAAPALDTPAPVATTPAEEHTESPPREVSAEKFVVSDGSHIDGVALDVGQHREKELRRENELGIQPHGKRLQTG